MVEFFETYQIGIYLCFLLLPIIQEDVGVLGAASACASGLANPFIAFILVLLGLTTSAMGKYFIGGAANHQSWAKKYAENPKVVKAGDRVKSNLGKSLIMARFVSPVRLPFYIASGFFKVSFLRVLFFVMSSAALYLGIAFGFFHIFGEAIGAQLKVYLPIAAIIILIGYFIWTKLHGHKFH